MPIDYKNTAYGQLNRYLIALNNVNYGLFRVMAQERRADDAEARGEIQLSEFARDWLSRKREAFAEHRNTVIEQFGKGFDQILEHHKSGYLEATRAFASVLKSRFPNKKFEEVVYDGEIIDHEVIDAYQAEGELKPVQNPEGTVVMPETPLINAYAEYLEKRGTYRIAESAGHVFDTLTTEIDSRGFQHLFTRRNETKDVKMVDADFVYEFYEFAKAIPATYKTELIKTQVQLKKLSKKLTKEPENEELQSLVYGHQYSVEFCQDVLERSDYLVMMSELLKDRMDSVNKQPYGIRDKVVETLSDLVFMVPSVAKGADSMPTYNTMYVGAYEIQNLINCVKEFPEGAVFTQYLSSKIERTTVIPAADFERSKIMMEFLSELHKLNTATIIATAKANGENLTDEEVKNKATNQDRAKFLVFETPLGKVWFDGENGIEVKTGKVIPFKEICKYVLNPNDGNIYYLQTDEMIKPGTVALVNGQPTGVNHDDGMGAK